MRASAPTVWKPSPATRADTQVRPYGLERGTGQIARAAPAERGRQGIRDLPGGFPQASTRGQGDFQPPQVRRVAAGDCPGFVSTHSEQPPVHKPTCANAQVRRLSDFFSWTGRGPFSFCQEQKENGGRIVSANADSPSEPDAPPPIPQLTNRPAPRIIFPKAMTERDGDGTLREPAAGASRRERSPGPMAPELRTRKRAP